MAYHKVLPDQDYLVSRLSYDPETGVLRWLPRPIRDFPTIALYNTWTKKFSGKVAGCSSYGYFQLRIDNVLYQAHRVIWKMVTGAEPALVDHKDRCRSNNKWRNLRDCSHAQNLFNQKLSAASTTGFKGVMIRKGKIVAKVCMPGAKQIWLGHFRSKEEAHEAWRTEAKKHRGAFFNPG